MRSNFKSKRPNKAEKQQQFYKNLTKKGKNCKYVRKLVKI